jgi:hypothetical protein
VSAGDSAASGAGDSAASGAADSAAGSARHAGGDTAFTAAWYERFADTEAQGTSAIYETWARGLMTDDALLTLLDGLPRPKRQPPLVFAVSRLLGAPVGPYPPWRDWAAANWPRLRAECAHRTTQTNEPLRCAPLLLALALIDGPIALLEVGASAGLCLFVDRYSYDFGGRVLHPDDGPSPVLLECALHTYGGPGRALASSELPEPATSGASIIPSRMPRIVWRAGIDLDPVDAANPEARRWLETLVPPEQIARRERMRAAARIASMHPPLMVRGDAAESLAALAARAPAAATLVVFTAGVLVYMGRTGREQFAGQVASLASSVHARWVSLEGPTVLPPLADEIAAHPAPDPGLFPLALDGRVVAWCGPHGQSIHWVGGR